MQAFFDDLTGLQKFFMACAVIGGICFAVRLILQFVGGDADGADGGGDVHVDFDGNTDIHDGSSDVSFKVLSFQGFTAFFMMFGLVGLALSKQSGVKELPSILGATLAGTAAAWMIKWMFTKAQGLQSSGNVKLENAIGHEGTVYLTIPEGGTGKIQIKFQNRLQTLEAVSKGGVRIETGQPVRVTRIVSDNILVVEKIEA